MIGPHGHPLVHAHYSRSDKPQRGHGVAHLAQARTKAASGGTFKVSTESTFAERLEVVIGLAPEHA